MGISAFKVQQLVDFNYQKTLRELGMRQNISGTTLWSTNHPRNWVDMCLSGRLPVDILWHDLRVIKCFSNFPLSKTVNKTTGRKISSKTLTLIFSFFLPRGRIKLINSEGLQECPWHKDSRQWLDEFVPLGGIQVRVWVLAPWVIQILGRGSDETAKRGHR